VPCKHLAATFYLLAEAFDADPFQLLHWRGRDREALLARLRELRTGAGASPVRRPPPSRRRGGSAAVAASATAEVDAAVDAGPVAGAGLVLADLPGAPLAGSVDRFWLPPVPLPARVPTLVTEPDLLLRQLGPPGAPLGGPGLVERLRRAYDRFAAQPD
jgi:hypothetical protein